jgi:hypothetical protein
MVPNVRDERRVCLILNPQNLYMLKSSECRYGQVQHTSVLARLYDVLLFVDFLYEVSDIEWTKAVLERGKEVLHSFSTCKFCQS